MAGPFVTNGYHVRLQYTLSTQLVENEFYFVSTVTPTEATMDALADLVLDWAIDDWHNLLPTNCAVTGCVVECLDEDFLLTKPYSLTSPVSGAGDSGVPNNVSFSVQRIILGRYKGGHPRLYVPGIRADKVTSINTLNETLLGTPLSPAPDTGDGRLYGFVSRKFSSRHSTTQPVTAQFVGSRLCQSSVAQSKTRSASASIVASVGDTVLTK